MAIKGLGKGLSALISEKNVHTSAREDAHQQQGRQNLPVTALQAGQFQPRSYFDENELRELAESIRKNGIVQPIIVRLVKDNQYEIVAGERRWRAAKIVGMDMVPVIIMQLDDKQAMEVALVENVQRQNLMLLEEAEGYKRLVDEFGYTQEQLADVIGKSRSQITNTLRLLNLPDEIKNLLNEDKLTAGHARALLTVENASTIAEEIIKKDLNVRQTEKLVKKLTDQKNGKRTVKLSNEKDQEIIRLEQELSKKTGLDITITNQDEKGKVVVSYHSLMELDQILRRLEHIPA